MATTTPAADSPPSSSRHARRYLSWIYLVVALVVSAGSLGFHYVVSSMLREQMLDEGRAFASEIVLNREWIENHGAVYVPMAPGTEVNPWLLRIPGLDVVIRDASGAPYMIKNPALVAGALSGQAGKKDVFRFRITSEKPLNPGNAPDAFERASLARFSGGADESYVYGTEAGRKVFRYMAPLPVEERCLRCHGFQGYKEGDIRGAISVTIDAAPMERQIGAYRLYLAGSAAGLLAVIYGVVGLLSRSFLRELRGAEDKLVEMATRDSLTELLNRREARRLGGVEWGKAVRKSLPLAAVLIDIDHFKKINDTRGHRTGDLAIKGVAAAMRSCFRQYDILCRYGGEEFLALFPETVLEQAVLAAERFREGIAATPPAEDDAGPVPLTVSAGVALLRKGETLDELIARADAALYAAKQGGRNRVCTQ
jgi:diguanylate cyclase (GGDEF)-like protein